MAVLTVGFEWDDASMNLHHNEFAKNPQSNNIGPKIFNDSTVCISYLFNFKSNKKIKILKGFIKLIYYISLFFFLSKTSYYMNTYLSFIKYERHIMLQVNWKLDQRGS